MNEMYGIFHGMYMLPRMVVSVNVVGRCIVALAMKIFLNLPLVSVTVMEKCGDIRLIDRLRIFMLFAILFCSLTLTDYSSVLWSVQSLKVVLHFPVQS